MIYIEKISVLKKEWLRREIEKLSLKGVSKADIARELEVKPQYLNTVLNSARGITDQFLDKFIERYGINHIDLSPTPMSHRDEQALPSEQDSVSAFEERLFAIIREKDAKIEEQAKVIGKLEGGIETLSKKTAITTETGDARATDTIG